MALIEKLRNIGDAIRQKTGKTELLTLEQMAEEIRNIKIGSVGNLKIDIDNRPDAEYSGSAGCYYLTLQGRSSLATVSLGTIDLSQYRSVQIYYGGDAKIECEGFPIGLLNSATLDYNAGTSAENVLAHGTMEDIEGRYPYTYDSIINLADVSYSGEVFLTVFGTTGSHYVQIYSVEFIA